MKVGYPHETRKSHKGLLVEDKKNAYAIASSWLGCGFGIEMGSRFGW